MADEVRPVVALTGATGFIGRGLAPLLAAAGWRVRLLLRRDPVLPEWRGLDPQIVAGDLGDAVALRQLVTGAAAVVHVAGLIKAARRRQYDAVNHAGSAALAAAVHDVAPAAHFLHVSTIAAREPRLSDYAASKRAGEDAVLRRLGERVTVLRPPAVYGPGDRETLVFFQLAGKGYVPLAGSPQARAAMIHVDDLTALLVALLREAPRGAVLTAADARPAGYSWHEVLRTAALAVGNPRARLFHAPAALLHGVALAGDLARACGTANMLNHQKLRELRHGDWSVSAAEWARPPGWQPRYRLDEGFSQTVAWYRRAGWL
ncbi:MAG TPA: NAD-dependent epimerase/dehydratase family protein [Steroidobacteraceae bacterium]|nr:NAD-dependent epimerase/dehydratase family protein [Steroidobacteraceae bacterium]